jgi:prepilin-type N-terminal cleavage/methylation domain-containing protein
MRRVSSERGFSLTEVLISTAIMLVVTGAIFGLMDPASGSAQAQPEVADIQQRMRVGSDVLFKDLVMAGAGPYQGEASGSLVNFFAPILPRRSGFLFPNTGGTTFESDAITLMYIPNSYSQTTIRDEMPLTSVEMKVEKRPNCPKGDELCGFEANMAVIIFDETGNFDAFTITHVQDSAGHLQHRGQNLSHKYQPGANVTQIISHTYYLENNQLMLYTGGLAPAVPIVDNVVGLQFEYFGDVNPPTRPKPPAGVANCVYEASGAPRNLAVLDPTEGSLAALPPAMLVDGPFCGNGNNQFDVDLLRVRKVRVTLRTQSAMPSLRGTDPALFVNPGTAVGGERFVPDYGVTFDVTPRNLNLAR